MSDMINRENEILYFETLLDLKHKVGGARFIEFEDEYKELNLPEQTGTMCFLGRKGVDGKHIKADAKHVVCDYGAYAVGIKQPHKSIKAGQSYAACGLYNSKAVARNIVENIHFLDQDIYGIEIGAAEDVENPDIVYIMCNTKQAMLIFQGYAYKYGNPANLSFFGNQAMCGDLLSKPYYNNDINMSLLCEGTRKYGNYNDDELGISMPAEMFHDVAYGVYKIINPVANLREKRELAKRLEAVGLGYDFITTDYGIELVKYDTEVAK